MTLSASQFSFITKEKKVSDARKKMIFAWCKEKNLEVPELDKRVPDPGLERIQMKKLDVYPELMDVEMLSKHLNLPNLQSACDDIRHNYLKRAATRQWIVEYPQSEINEKQIVPVRIPIPGTLKSLMSEETVKEVIELWKKRYGHLKSTIGEPIKFE